jgi:drug/metabolite transporter (DMT)-like permease
VVVKAAIGVLGPFTFTSARYLVASLVLFLIVLLRHGRIRRPPGTWRTLMGLGVLGFGCYQLFWTTGLTMITAGDSALIVAVAPVLTALIAGAVGMDRLTPPKLGGALIAFCGVALVIAASHQVSLGASLLGDALTLTAAVLWAVYTVAGARMLRSVDPLQATAWAVLGGTLFLLPFGAAELVAAPPTAVVPGALVAVVFSGALAAGVANVFVFNGIRLAGPTRVAASQFLVPFGAVLLGSMFLSEPVGVAQVAGGVIIVFGVWLTRRRSLVPRGLREQVRGA